MNYLFYILIMCEIYLILALATDLVAGYAGMLTMSQAASYGTGAYVTALVMTKLGAGFATAVICAIGFNLIAMLPVVWFAIRLRDLYFSLATLAWQIIVFTVLYNWTSVTAGSFGITGIPRPPAFDSLPAFALLAGGIALCTLAFFKAFHQTPLSRLMRGMRDDQISLMAFGKKPAYYKAVALMLAGVFTAVAGSLFASYFSYIDPTSFTLEESMLLLSIIFIGGLSSIKGAVSGAFFYVMLPEALRFLPLPDAVAANMRMMVYALILIVIVIYRPNGFFGTYKYES